MDRKIVFLVPIFSLCAFSVFAQENNNNHAVVEGQKEYLPPVTVENISDKDKRNPSKVSEALANTFLNALQQKKYTQESIAKSIQMQTTLTCIQYNKMQQVS